MKKFYLLIAIAGLAFAGNAQNVKFYENGKEIPKNSTYTFNNVEEDFSGLLLHPAITLKAEASTTVKVSANCTTGQEIQLCFDGGCKAGVNVTSNPVTMTKGVSYNLDYKYEPMSFDPIEDVITSVITVTDNITNVTVNEITVTYDPNAGSVNAVVTDSDLSYTDGVIKYNVNQATSLSLYNAAGQIVAKSTANGSGEFSTALLPTGVYIYRLGNNTGKILVK